MHLSCGLPLERDGGGGEMGVFQIGVKQWVQSNAEIIATRMEGGIICAKQHQPYQHPLPMLSNSSNSHLIV